jgi:hypothetical protein
MSLPISVPSPSKTFRRASAASASLALNDTMLAVDVKVPITALSTPEVHGKAADSDAVASGPEVPSRPNGSAKIAFGKVTPRGYRCCRPGLPRHRRRNRTSMRRPSRRWPSTGAGRRIGEPDRSRYARRVAVPATPRWRSAVRAIEDRLRESVLRMYHTYATDPAMQVSR